MVTVQGQRVLTGWRYERKALPRRAARRILTIARNTTVDPMLLQSKHCATLVFERTLRVTSPHSCFFSQIGPGIDI